MTSSLENASASTTTIAVPTDSTTMSGGEIVTLTVMLIVSTLSFVGNLLVIGAVYVRESLRTPNNLLLLNLAVADLGQGIIAMPLRMTEIFNRGTEPVVPCLFVLYVTILFFGTSMITVALISMDRFIAIRWPFLYVKLFTHGSIVIAITCAWMFMFIFAAIPYLGAAVTPVIETKFCFYSQYLSKAYLLAMFSIVNILIIVILLFTNTYLLKQTLWHITKIKSQVVPMAWNENTVSTPNDTISHRQHNNHNNHSNRLSQHASLETQVGRTRARYHREIKATKVTLAIVGFTIVLTTPIMVIDLVSIWCPTCSPSVVTRISVAMAYANSCVNPWIFAGLNKLYRQTYLEVLQKLRNFLTCNR